MNNAELIAFLKERLSVSVEVDRDRNDGLLVTVCLLLLNPVTNERIVVSETADWTSLN